MCIYTGFNIWYRHRDVILFRPSWARPKFHEAYLLPANLNKPSLRILLVSVHLSFAPKQLTNVHIQCCHIHFTYYTCIHGEDLARKPNNLQAFTQPYLPTTYTYYYMILHIDLFGFTWSSRIFTGPTLNRYTWIFIATCSYIMFPYLRVPIFEPICLSSSKPTILLCSMVPTCYYMMSYREVLALSETLTLELAYMMPYLRGSYTMSS